MNPAKIYAFPFKSFHTAVVAYLAVGSVCGFVITVFVSGLNSIIVFSGVPLL